MTDPFKVVPDYPRYEITSDLRVRDRATNKMKNTHTSREGYLVIRHNVGQGKTKRRRELGVHRLLYSANKGAIPADHVVFFKNENRHDVRLANLGCVSSEDFRKLAKLRKKQRTAQWLPKEGS